MSTITDRLALLITADASGAVREINKVGTAAERDLGKATTNADKFGNTALKTGAAMVGFSALVGGALYKAAKASSDAQTAELKLQNTIANSPKLAGASTQAFDDLAKSIQGYSVVDDEAVKTTEATLGQFGLTQKQILALTPLVVDLSRKMGIDLDSASKAVGKAVEGNVGGLQRLGVIVTKNKDGTVGYNNVLNTLKGTVGGFAAAEGRTFEGQMARIHNQLHDVEEGIGVGVVHALGSVIDPLAKVSRGFNNLDDSTKASVGRLLTIGTGVVGTIGALGLMAGSVAKLRSSFTNAEGEMNAFGRTASTVGSIGGFTIGVLAGAEALSLLGDKIVELTAGRAGVGSMSLALEEYTKNAKPAGELTKQFGDNLGGLKSKIDQIKLGVPDLLHSTALKDAKNDFDALDQSLAQLVSSGHGDLAAQAHDKLAAAVTGAGGKVKDLDHLLPHYRDAMDAATLGTKLNTDATKTNATSEEDATSAVKDHTQALQSLRDEALATIKSDEGVVKAHETLDQANKEVAKHARDLAEAHRGVTDAQRSEKRATDDLSRAQRDAPLHLAEAKQSEKEAIDSVADAQDALTVAIARYGSQSRQAVDAQDKLTDAQNRQKEAHNAVGDLTVGGRAKEIADAEQQVTDAKQSTADAQQRLNDLEAEDPTKAVTDAQRGLTDALIAQADQRTKFNEDLATGKIKTGELVTSIETLENMLRQAGADPTVLAGIDALLKILNPPAVPVPQPLKPGQFGPPTYAPMVPQPLSPGQVGPPTYVPAPSTAQNVTNINVTAQTNASAQDIANEVAWASGTRGVA